MDYTSVPEGSAEYGPANASPNEHDFDQLQAIDAHLSDTSSGGGKGGGNRTQPRFFEGLPAPVLQHVPIDSPAAWGRPIRSDGRIAAYELDLGNGFALFTFVTWRRGKTQRVLSGWTSGPRLSPCSAPLAARWAAGHRRGA
jgi:hypothetical protein